MKTLKIAEIGCRHVHSEKFVRIAASQPGCEVKSVWDEERKLSELVAAHIGCQAVSGWEEIVNDPDIDAVIISVPAARHAFFIKAAAEKGKHILVEKPLCLTAEEAFAIRQAVRQNHVHFAVSDPMVHDGEIYVRKFIESGKIGQIVSARARITNNDAIRLLQLTGRDAGLPGAVEELGCHALHVLQYLFGRPDRVSACYASTTEAALREGREETAAAILHYPNGLISVFETSLVSPSGTKSVEVNGTEGCIRVSYLAREKDRVMKNEVRWKLGDGAWQTVPQQELPENPIQHVVFWLQIIQEDLPESVFVTDDRSRNLIGLDDAVDIACTIDAIGRAARQQGILLKTEDRYGN